MTTPTTSQSSDVTAKELPNESVNELNTPRPRSQTKLVLSVLLVVICLFLIAGSAATALAYSITYRNYSLGNPDLETKVSQYVQNLPFTPKTNKFLIEAMVVAQEKVSKHSFDVSLASQSNDLASSLGLTSFEMQAKGNVDYSDQKNVKTSLTASLANQYDLELRKNDNNSVYLKVNKIPELIYAFFGVQSTDIEPLLTQWIVFDTTPLNTDAKKYLDENSEQKKASEHFVEQMNKILQEELVMSKLEQSQEVVDGHQTYKIHFVADPATIDYLEEKLITELQNAYPTPGMMYSQRPGSDEKLSETVKKLSMDIWVDKDDYYMRKAISAVTLVLPSPKTSALGTTPTPSILPENAEYSFAFALSLDDFGKDFEVETPQGAVKFDDLVKQLQTKLSLAAPITPYPSQLLPTTTQFQTDRQLTATEWETVQSNPVFSIGESNAKVTMIEFVDYQCPFCSRYYYTTYKQLLGKYVKKGELKMIFKDNPLPFHKNAHSASQAARCAGEQQGAEAMHDQLYETQQQWANLSGEQLLSKYSDIAKNANLDGLKVAECVRSSKYKLSVDADISLAARYGVSGAPTFFINGKQLVGAQPLLSFEAEIDAALNR